MSSNAKITFTKIKNITDIMPNIAKNNPKNKTKTKDDDEHPFYDVHNLLDNSPSVDLNYDTNKIEVPVLDSVTEEKLWKAFLSYQYYDDLYDLEQAYNEQPEPVKEEDKNEWEKMFEDHEQLEGTNKESSDLFNSIDEQNDYLSFLESGKLGENLLGFFSKSESEVKNINKKEKAKKLDLKKSDIVETQLVLYPDFIDESDESKVIRMEDFIRGDPGPVVDKKRYGDQIIEKKNQENLIQKIQSIKLPKIPALESFFPTSATSPIVSGISSKFPKYNISDFVSTTYDSYSISNPIKINSKNRDRLGLQKLGYSPKFRKSHAKNGNGNRGSKVIFTVFKKNPNLHNHENGDVLNQKDLPTETILLGILLLLLIYCSTCFLTKLYYIRRNYLIILKNNKKNEEKIRKYGIVDHSRHLTINETSVETLQTSQNLMSSENSNFLNGTTTTLTVPNPTTDDSQLSKNSRISVKSIAVVLENIKKASQFSLKHDLQTELIRSQTGIICEKTICGLLDHHHNSSDLSGHNHIGQCCNSNLIRNHFKGRIIAAQQEFDL